MDEDPPQIDDLLEERFRFLFSSRGTAQALAIGNMMASRGLCVMMRFSPRRDGHLQVYVSENHFQDAATVLDHYQEIADRVNRET